jgi:hypothetical protein
MAHPGFNLFDVRIYNGDVEAKAPCGTPSVYLIFLALLLQLPIHGNTSRIDSVASAARAAAAAAFVAVKVAAVR